MEKPDLNAIAAAVRKRAEWVMENPEERWQSKNSWKEDIVSVDTDPKPAPFEPTGHASLDALVTTLNPSMLYGSTPRTEVRGDWELERAFAGAFGLKFIDDDPERIHIVMPHKDDFLSDDGYCSTLTHELFHWWAEHVPSIRISGGLSGKGGPNASPQDVDPAYIAEEMSAELCSAMLLAAMGLDPHIEERGEYLAGYFNAVPDKVMDDGTDLRNSVFAIAKEQAVLAVEGMLAKVSK